VKVDRGGSSALGWQAMALTIALCACANSDPIEPSGGTGAVVTGGSSQGGSGAGADGGAANGGASGGTGGDGAGGEGAGGAGARGGGGSGGVEPPPPGSPSTQSVSAGNVSTSPGYRMIHTFGQPTILQGPNVSPSYQMIGGLVGANESLP
jgi:hypothetical protein